MENGQGAPTPAPSIAPSFDDVETAIRELASPGDGATVKVWRWDIQHGRYAYCAAIPASDCNLEMVRGRYGAGRFKFVVIPEGGRGTKTIVHAIAAEGAAPDNGAPAGELDELRTMIRAQQAAIDRLAASLNVRPQGDPIETAIKILTVVNATRAEQPSPAASMKDMLEIFRQGLDIGMNQAGGADADPMGKMVDNVFPQLLGLMKRSVDNDEKRATALAGRVKLPAAAPGSPSAPAAAPAGGTAAPALQDAIRGYVAPIAARMNAGRDAACVATWFLEELSNAHVDELAALTASPSFVADGLALFPEMRAANEPWLTDFLSSLKEQLSTGQEDGPTS